MKSLVVYLQGLYREILTDISVGDARLRRECERDLAHICSLSSARGSSFFTIELPSVGKALDRALSTGHLPLLCAAGFAPHRRGSRIPKLFRGLWTRVFADDGCLKEHPCLDSIVSLRQVLYLAKKIRLECTDARRQKAIRDLFRHEENLRPPTLSWMGSCEDGFDSSDLHLRDGFGDQNPKQGIFPFMGETPSLAPELWDVIQQSMDLVSAQLGVFDPMTARFKHGPGAVASRPTDDDKYRPPSWPNRLENVFPFADVGTSSYSTWVDRLTTCEVPSDLDEPCRLLTVPKDQKGPRVIACEPVSHQWCQQALWLWLEERTSKFWLANSIRFRDQSRNQSLALAASATQSHATIDLSKASDSVTTWLVERAFRRNKSLLRALRASRSAWMVYHPKHGTARHIALKKFGAMGSATTFPVQSVIYACIALGVLLYSRGLKVSIANMQRVSHQVSVFGDDIVIPSDTSERFIEVLTHLGFLVNVSKTFTEGFFRESCGVEGYAGVLCTPAYFLEAFDKARPSSMMSVVQTANNFFSKGYWRAARYIESTLPSSVLRTLPVRRIGEGSHGRHSFCGDSVSHLRSRYNTDLHRQEVLARVLVTRAPRRFSSGISSLHQYFTEAPRQDTDWCSGVATRPKSFLALRWDQA